MIKQVIGYHWRNFYTISGVTGDPGHLLLAPYPLP